MKRGNRRWNRSITQITSGRINSPTHIIQPFKTRFSAEVSDQNMFIKAYFWKKVVLSPQRWGLGPQSPIGLQQLETPFLVSCVVTPATDIALTSAFLALNAFYYHRKLNKTAANVLHLLLPSFFHSNYKVFVGGSAKAFFVPKRRIP